MEPHQRGDCAGAEDRQLEDRVRDDELDKELRFHLDERVDDLIRTEVVCAPSSPWQNPYAERLIGSIRRECLNHVIVLNQRHLRRLLSRYVVYYHRARPHLSLAKDAPTPRRVQTAADGPRVVAFPEVGGLHHRYERRAA
jgi:putative transposase